jgi:hypothetical protein
MEEAQIIPGTLAGHPMKYLRRKDDDTPLDYRVPVKMVADLLSLSLPHQLNAIRALGIEILQVPFLTDRGPRFANTVSFRDLPTWILSISVSKENADKLPKIKEEIVQQIREMISSLTSAPKPSSPALTEEEVDLPGLYLRLGFLRGSGKLSSEGLASILVALQYKSPEKLLRSTVDELPAKPAPLALPRDAPQGVIPEVTTGLLPPTVTGASGLSTVPTPGKGEAYTKVDVVPSNYLSATAMAEALDRPWDGGAGQLTRYLQRRALNAGRKPPPSYSLNTLAKAVGELAREKGFHPLPSKNYTPPTYVPPLTKVISRNVTKQTDEGLVLSPQGAQVYYSPEAFRVLSRHLSLQFPKVASERLCSRGGRHPDQSLGSDERLGGADLPEPDCDGRQDLRCPEGEREAGAAAPGPSDQVRGARESHLRRLASFSSPLAFREGAGTLPPCGRSISTSP